MILVTFDNGQPNKLSDLQKIQAWWQNMNGKIPHITKVGGNMMNKQSSTVSLNSPVTNVGINGNIITWNNGTTMTAIATSVVLDVSGNNLKFSVASDPSINWEFQY